MKTKNHYTCFDVQHVRERYEMMTIAHPTMDRRVFIVKIARDARLPERDVQAMIRTTN